MGRTERHEDYRNPPAETKVEQRDPSTATVIQPDGSISSDHSEVPAYAKCASRQRGPSTDDELGG